MIYYKDTPVFIGSTGILAQTVNVNSSNSVNFSNTSNFYSPSNFYNNPITNSISINYISKVGEDPIINDLSNVKKNLKRNNFLNNNLSYSNIEPVVVRVGEIYGSFYITSCSLTLSSNSILNVSADLISFVPITGGGSQIYQTDNIKTKESLLANSNSINLVNRVFAESPFSIYGLSYSTSKRIDPSYNLGSLYPIEVNLIGMEEKTTIELDYFNDISLTGKSINEVLNNYNYLQISSYTNPLTTTLIDLSDQIIQGISHNFASNQQMKVNIEAGGQF